MKAFCRLDGLLIAPLGVVPALTQLQLASTRVDQMHTSAANAESERRLIELVETCIGVVRKPEFAKDRLRFAGWTDLGPHPTTLPVYSESSAGLFEKGPALLSYLASESSVGQQNPDAYYPVCEAFLTDSKLSCAEASSALAAHLDADGLVHEPDDEELGTQYVFVAEGHAVAVAAMIKQPGTLQILVMPEPLDTENEE